MVIDGNADADFLEQFGILSQQYGDRVAFGKVEAKNAPKMIEYFDVKQFPALKYFRYTPPIYFCIPRDLTCIPTVSKRPWTCVTSTRLHCPRSKCLFGGKTVLEAHTARALVYLDINGCN